ncbi:MAG: AsmA-like C-terminal region-containing protein [Desulfoplanes sp.]|nr:AsmA-like C-terminal region-containing protein [Desulfoplanes sp.]
MTANAITWQDITTSTASATFRAQKGILRIYPLNIRLFDGRATGTIRTDLGGNQPVTRIRTNLKDLRILTTGNENPRGASIQGTFTSYIDVTGQGALWAMDQSTLNGTVSLLVTNGTLRGMNLQQTEHDRDGTQRFSTSPKILPFTSLSAQGTLFAGTISVQDADLQAEHLHLKGTGTYDLAADHLLGKIRVADADNTWRILRISGSAHQPAITIRKSSGPQQKPVHSIPHGPASPRTIP